MLDIKFIRENSGLIKKAAKDKQLDVDIDKLLRLDKARRETQNELDAIRAKKNEIARTNKGAKPSPDQIEEGKKLKEAGTELETKMKEVNKEFNALMSDVPNIYSEDTPIGKEEDNNKIIKTVGEPTKFDFEPKDHMKIGAKLGIIDTDKSAVISGSRFNYLFGGAVLLQFAIIQYVMETLTNEKIIKKLAKKTNNPSAKPFIPVIPPVMAKSEIMKKMDRFDPIDDRYFFEADDILLIGSAEHTLGPLHMNETIKEDDLPIRYVGYSTAFRREAGTYGKDASGILRRHQFDKAEMETFTTKEQGILEQDFIVAIQEYFVQSLEIPYQLVLKCTGDMGKPDFRAIDIECWLPGQNKYRETHTSDYMTDFQARRLNIKYQTKGGQKEYVHMNDATAFAIGRILIAIVENYQNEDGTVRVPDVLQKYLPRKMEIIN